jgi:signal transduction histidine kinase
VRRFVFHEVRVPFNSLYLALECLDDEGRSAEDAELIGTMKDSAASMKRLINDVLSFQKIQEGQVELLPQPTRLWPTLAHLVATWQQHPASAHLTLGADCADDDPLRDAVRAFLVFCKH